MLLAACENVDEIGLSSDQDLHAKAASEVIRKYVQDQLKAMDAFRCYYVALRLVCRINALTCLCFNNAAFFIFDFL